MGDINYGPGLVVAVQDPGVDRRHKIYKLSIYGFGGLCVTKYNHFVTVSLFVTISEPCMLIT